MGLSYSNVSKFCHKNWTCKGLLEVHATNAAVNRKNLLRFFFYGHASDESWVIILKLSSYHLWKTHLHSGQGKSIKSRTISVKSLLIDFFDTDMIIIISLYLPVMILLVNSGELLLQLREDMRRKHSDKWYRNNWDQTMCGYISLSIWSSFWQTTTWHYLIYCIFSAWFSTTFSS